LADAPSILTPLQVNVGAGMLQNQGVAVNAAFANAIASYANVTLISTLLGTIGNAIATSTISNVTIAELNVLASNSCPALADSIPFTYVSNLDADAQVGNNIIGFTSILTLSANQILGEGDVSKFCQTLSQAQGHNIQTATFVNSAINGQTYLGSTFTGMDSMITGSVSSVNLATTAFGQDLTNLGQLIDTGNLNNLGSPLALVQQIYRVVGAIPALSIAFVLAGISQDVVVNLSDPTVSVVDSDQKLMYTAMAHITGDTLAQILTVLNVKTVGIATMSDLLNPVKLFPNSFQSLTVPLGPDTYPIYVDANGAVNTSLLRVLPSYVLTGAT
jgi:hypothetical protein